jgi:hypothetical protein
MIPEFTADAALYTPTRSYRMGSNGGSGGREPQISAQQFETKNIGTSYACTSAACACAGSADCAECALSGHCHGSYVCQGSNPQVCIFGPG